MTIAILDARDKEYVVVAAGADLIATYVQQAIAAGETAQEVLDAILAAGLSEGVFPSLAAGESGTAPGQYFWVGEGGTVTLYLNDSGTGSEVAELATAAGLAAKVDIAALASSSGGEMVGFAEGASPPVAQSASQALSALVRTGKTGILSTAGYLDDHRAGVLAYRKMTGGQAELLTDLGRFYPEGSGIEPASPPQPVFLEFTADNWVATGNPDVKRHKFTGWTGGGPASGGSLYTASVFDEAEARAYSMKSDLFGDYEAKVWWDGGNGYPNVDIRMPTGISPPASVRVLIGFWAQSNFDALYVDPVNGDDRNDGHSFTWALRTPAAAIARAPKAIFLKPGVYAAGSEIGIYTGGDVSIRAVGGKAIFIPAFTSVNAWTLDSGATYVAHINTSGTPTGVVDASAYDAFGLPVVLATAASLADCQATEGTRYFDAATRNMYVHLSGGRVPSDALVRPMRSAGVFSHRAPGAKVQIADCVFVSGSGGAAGARLADASAVLIAERCAAVSSYNTNGFDIQDIGLAILKDSIATKNLNDGFNYTEANGLAPHFIEIGCVATENISGGTNNGSTSHGSVRGFRINCDYAFNSGPGVADVNDTRTFNVNVSSCFNGPSAAGIGFQAADNAVQMVDGGCGYGNGGPDFHARDAASVLKARDCYARTQGGDGTIGPL